MYAPVSSLIYLVEVQFGQLPRTVFIHPKCHFVNACKIR